MNLSIAPEILACFALVATASACDVEEADLSPSLEASAESDRGAIGKADLPGSCEAGGANFCGAQSSDGCWCDTQCVEFGDCCSDRGPVCLGEPEPEPEDGCATPATYLVDVDMDWTTPGVPNRHWSPVVGATHRTDTDFWSFDGFATPGIEEMAETGGTGPLVAEVESSIASGLADEVLLGSNISTGDGSTQLEITVDSGFPAVTLVTMMAPSPDWFVGLDGVSLCQGGQWIEGTAQMFVFDAGTDSGADFTSPNADTNPQQSIGLAPRFAPGGEPVSVGTMTFSLQ